MNADKLLARMRDAEQNTRTLSFKEACYWLKQWRGIAREALAQPAEATKDCLQVPPGNGFCDQCAAGNYAQCRYIAQPAEAVEAKWVTDLRNEAVRGSMKDVYWLSRDQVFELIGDATGRKTPAHPDVIVARATDAAQGAVADVPSALLSVPDWAIAAAYRAAVSRLVPNDRMSALAFASEVTVAAEHEWRTHPQAAPAQGDGTVRVPAEPTGDMLSAAYSSLAEGGFGDNFGRARAVWSAMIAAAPSPEPRS